MAAVVERSARRPVDQTQVRLWIVVLNTVIAFVLVGLWFIEGVFRDGSGWALAAAVAVLVATAAIGASHRYVGNDALAVLLVMESIVVLLVAVATDSLVLLAASIAAMSVIPVLAATTLTRLAVVVFAAAGSLSVAVVVLSREAGVVAVALAVPAVFVLMAVPPMLIVRYRDHIEATLLEVELAAGTDPLTGLLNRRGMAQRIPDFVARADLAGEWLGVLVADADHFKEINDRYGHQAGDQVLAALATTVRSVDRGSDLRVRLGGDELCLLTRLRDHDDLVGIAERLRLAVNAVPGPVSVSMSIGGVWSAATPTDDPITRVYALIDDADRLMLGAKAAGGDTVRIIGVA